jgi:hypothetical protein
MRPWGKRTDSRYLPVFTASMRPTFGTGILKVSAVVAIPILGLMWFGQPALLFQYWWHGSPLYPVYEKCLYIAPLDGWHLVFPDYRDNPRICPTVRFFHVDIRKLLWS